MTFVVVVLLTFSGCVSQRFLLCRDMDFDQCESLQNLLQRATVGPMQPVFRGMDNGTQKE